MRSSPVGQYESPRGQRPARRRSGCGCLGGLLFIAAVLLVPSLLIDMSGTTTPARVDKKREDVHLSDDGSWWRSLELGVVKLPADYATVYPMVSVDEARYDRLRVGDTVRVRYVECCSIFARLADRSTRDWVRDAAPYALRELRWMAWLVGGLLFLAFAGRYGPAYLLAAAVAWAAAALVLDRTTPRPVPNDGRARAVARVRDVRRVDFALPGRRESDVELRLPYDLVALAFVPRPGADTVVAVDGVDAESVPRLAVDSTVRVRFDPAAPRAAAIDGGARTYYDANRPLFVAIVAGIVGVATLLGLLLSSKAASRRRGRR